MKRKLLTMLAVLALSFSVFNGSVFADYYSSSTPLYKGMQNSDVTNLQHDLARLGYFYYTPTGYFGALTQQAVLAYQRSNGLAADGIVGQYTAREIKIDRIVETAKQYDGTPYVWGGTSPSGFDCSGFTQYVFSNNGIYLPRTASQQYVTGTWVSRSSLRPGDLVFFSTYSAGASHVGIYIGNNQFINAGSSRTGVYITEMSNSYWAPRYIGARRVIH